MRIAVIHSGVYLFINITVWIALRLIQYNRNYSACDSII